MGRQWFWSHNLKTAIQIHCQLEDFFFLIIFNFFKDLDILDPHCNSRYEQHRIQLQSRSL